ncbi:ubiquitin carboxyl-terminal hydrolase 48 [Rhizoctonia solani]|uniref:ubiquitinyl hydrolase 1 n=1 Tax=Rhizoctonia solani TaxID=456999 RepID=A0A0K6G982_9AGAM|nr:ubiquitin carboxyl-terminal hydrolase 48 [Rhizoctonia solani]
MKHQFQTSSTRPQSWRNQLRRPVPKGLARGERLSRSAFATAATFSEWGWVGTEVGAAEDIGPQHRAAACGFRKRICKNKSAPRVDPPPAKSGAEDDVVVISSDDDEPECSIKACKANPNCCNYLGQRNWENEATARKSYLEAAELGDDPKDSGRDSGLPVGLKNLGATCYANAFLQVWFQDIAFRAGVYTCVPELSLLPGKGVEESPIYQLQMTFGALQHSNEKAFNPVKLVECLGIRAGEQQDAQEFSKLFMSHLDNEFKKQENTLVRSLVTDQFEGRQVYGTRCATCQNASEHQSTFLEIEISLTSDCKLEDRLKANLEDEKLDGDNRYDCSTCGTKQDAFRYLRLTHLPPVLHFSVLRFVFDAKDFSRKKSKHAITFPLSIDMRPFLSEDGAEIWYELRGVLLHRGPSAYHGHYEAQVFDVTRNAWFQFNDEEVRQLKLEDLVGKQTNGRVQTSKDAYMLIYAQRDAPSLDPSILNVPKHAFDAVQQLNKEYLSSCEAYVRKKQELESEFSALREQKREIYQTWQISDVDEVSMVLSKSALEAWLLKELDKTTFNRSARKTAEISHPIPSLTSDLRQRDGSPSPPPPDKIFGVSNGEKDNTQKDIATPAAHKIVCTHGLLDPSESVNMKRISMSAWERIQEMGIDATAIESNRICEDCTAALFNEKLYTLQHDDMVSRFDASMGRDRGSGNEWWISKSWLKDWKLKKPKMHVNGCRDPIPDASRFRSDVYCEHDRLTPSQKFRERISTPALEVLKEAFPEFEPPDTETETCTICEAIAASDREANREARAKAEAERTRLPGLARRDALGTLKATKLVQGTYYLIPLSFVTQWRGWQAKPLTAPRPGPIANDQFICEHDGLIINPMENEEMDGAAFTITTPEWEILGELYGGGPCIECTLESDDESGDNNLESNRPLCQDCRKSRLSDYNHAQINVYRLADGESLPDVNGATNQPAQTEKAQSTEPDVIHIDDTDAESPTLSDSPPARAPGARKRPKPVTTYGQRRSKRIRTAATAKKGKTFSIWVSKDDTIRDVKRQIEDAEDIVPFYQQLYLHGVELTDDTQTLLQVGFLRNDRLILRAIEAMDEDEAVNWALTSGDVEPKTVRPRNEGRAFGGTLLGSTYAAPAVPTTSTEQSTSAASHALAIETEPGPSRENDSSEDQDMASVPSTISDGIVDLDSRLAQELAAEDAESSFHIVDDETEATGLSCASCTYLNHPRLKYCEMCERELVL